MDLSNIKKIVLEEGKVVIIDGDDALVVMSFNEYEKIKSKRPEPSPALPKAEIKADEASELRATAGEAEKSSNELTLDDLPF